MWFRYLSSRNRLCPSLKLEIERRRRSDGNPIASVRIEYYRIRNDTAIMRKKVNYPKPYRTRCSETDQRPKQICICFQQRIFSPRKVLIGSLYFSSRSVQIKLKIVDIGKVHVQHGRSVELTTATATQLEWLNQ